jgi:hypothetical protein
LAISVREIETKHANYNRGAPFSEERIMITKTLSLVMLLAVAPVMAQESCQITDLQCLVFCDAGPVLVVVCGGFRFDLPIPAGVHPDGIAVECAPWCYWSAEGCELAIVPHCSAVTHYKPCGNPCASIESLIFADSFETGNTGAWSASLPQVWQPEFVSPAASAALRPKLAP